MSLIVLLHFFQPAASLLIPYGASLAVKLPGLFRILGDAASIAIQMAKSVTTHAVPPIARVSVTVHHERQCCRVALWKIRFVAQQNVEIAASYLIACIASIHVEVPRTMEILCDTVAKLEHHTEIITSVRLPTAASLAQEGTASEYRF